MTTLATDKKRAIESIGGKKKLNQQASQYRSDLEHLEKNKDALLKEHPDQWLAIYKGVVQAVADDPQRLTDMVESKNLSSGEVVITFLATEKIITLF